MPMLDDEHKALAKEGWRAIRTPDHPGDDMRRERGLSGFGGMKPPARLVDKIKFDPGSIMFSPGGRAALSLSGSLDHDLALQLLERFIQGDWGPDTSPEMAAANDKNLAEDGVVTAVYSVGHGMFVYLTSDGQRTTTTFVGAGEMQR